jgi:uncharacterized protein YegL
MKTGYTEITFVIDKSGSMAGKESDVINGFDNFINEQKKVSGDCTVSVTLFDTTLECVYEVEKLHSTPTIKDKYLPSGMTALLDAVGTTIHNVGKRLAGLGEDNKPERVIFVIITDGEENSSQWYKLSGIKKMIQERTDFYKWEFVFLGVGLDAFKSASDIGVSAQNTVTYTPDAAGIKSSYDSLSKNISYSRENKVSYEWKHKPI